MPRPRIKSPIPVASDTLASSQHLAVVKELVAPELFSSTLFDRSHPEPVTHPTRLPQRSQALQPSPRKPSMLAQRNCPSPLTNAAYSHQLSHHLTQQAANERRSKMHKYFEPSNDAGIASSSTRSWHNTWKRIELDRQTQLQTRQRYFALQAQRNGQNNQADACDDDDALFSAAPIVSMQPEQFSIDLLSTLEANTVGGCCGPAMDSDSSTSTDANAHASNKERPDYQTHDHDHSSGFIAVDLDEAAHGAYASTKYLIDGVNGSPAQIVHQIKQDALLAAIHPKASLIKDIVPHGVGDFAAGVSASVGVLPLAGLAIHAGIHEIKDAAHQLKALNLRSAALNREVETLESLKEIIPELSIDLQGFDATKKNLAFAKRLAKNDRAIGISSALSGSAIAVKSTVDIGLKTTLVALQKKFSLLDIAQQGTQIGTAGLVTGAAGTLVLGPLAGIFAASLGVFFVRKSTAKRRQLKAQFALAKQQIAGNMALNRTAGMEQPQHVLYRDFILRQGAKRISFFKKFGNWNKLFLSGSGLYAASATTKMIVASLALAGVGAAAANPVGLGIILGVGIVGALVMGAASLSFFYGHEKQGRYAKHTSKDHADVDREFLCSLELFRVLAAEGTPDPAAVLKWSALGLNTRAACLQRLDSRKESLARFVADAAKASGKTMPRDPKNHLWNKWSSAIQTAAHYAATLGTTLSPVRAELHARNTRMHVRKELGSRTLENWIGTQVGSDALMQFAKEDLHAKVRYLKVKLTARLDLTNQKLATDPQSPAEDGKTVLDAFTTYLTQQDALVEKDQAELERCQVLLAQIERVQPMTRTEMGTRPALNSSSSNADSAEQDTKNDLLENMVEYFDSLSSLPKETPPKRMLAKLLIKDLYKDTKEARGVLFETQLQASALRESAVSENTVQKEPVRKPGFFSRIFARKS